jgi:hypothetical protein
MLASMSKAKHFNVGDAMHVVSGLYAGVSEEAKLEEKIARKPVDQ